MELRKVKGHDERRLAEENFDHMTGRVNRAYPLYQLEIPFEDNYGERERPSFDYHGRLQDSFQIVDAFILFRVVDLFVCHQQQTSI